MATKPNEGAAQQTGISESPADFITRLAALVPRPRSNLTRYHGIFAPSSPMRAADLDAAIEARI